MLTHDEDWLIDSSELTKQLNNSGKIRGPLCFLPDKERSITKDEADDVPNDILSGLNEDQRVLFDACLTTISNPVKVVQLDYNIVDVRVSHSVLSVSSELPGLWVTLGGLVDPLRLSTRSGEELRLLVSRVLSALSANVRATMLGCDLSTEAALVFIAVLDHYRRSFLISMVQHIEPITIFSAEDIIDRLNESEEGDFRWALSFVNKLLPIPVKEWSVAKDPRPALLELVQAEIIKAVDDGGTSFDLTEAGLLLAETNRMAESRVVMLTAYLTPEEDLIQEVFFLFRSAIDLFLVQMSGAEASLVSMLPADLEKLLHYIFAIPKLQEKLPSETPKLAEDLPPAENIIIKTDSSKPSAQPPVETSRADQEQEWYISRGEEQYGPYSDEDMISFAQQGNLHPEDLIWSEETGDWVRADSVGKFFT
jgi:hypothetical protein